MVQEKEKGEQEVGKGEERKTRLSARLCSASSVNRALAQGLRRTWPGKADSLLMIKILIQKGKKDKETDRRKQDM